MALHITHQAHEAEPGWWQWAAWIEGDEDERAEVERVRYVLHPSFRDPVRDVTDRGSKFRLEASAWSGFRLLANVYFHDGRRQTLEHDLPLDSPAADGEEGSRPVPIVQARRQDRSASVPRWMIRTAAALAVLAAIGGYLLFVSWPDGSGVVRVAGDALRFRAGRDPRLLMVAACAGFLGGAAQSLAVLANVTGNRYLRSSWAAWFLLRPLTGAALAAIAYLVLRGFLFSPGAQAGDVNTVAVALLGGIVGASASPAIAALGEFFDRILLTARAPLAERQPDTTAAPTHAAPFAPADVVPDSPEPVAVLASSGAGTDLTARADGTRVMEEPTAQEPRPLPPDMIHELRIHVNTMAGYQELLLNGTYGELPPPARAMLERANASTRTLMSLLGALADYTRLETGKMTVNLVAANVPALLAEAVRYAWPLAEARGIGLAWEVKASDVPVRTDPDHVRQVLRALLTTAIEFTHEGRVTVVAEPVADASGERWMELRVCGMAPGLAPKDLDRIFLESGTAGRSRSAAGMGLAISRRLAQLLGGDLRLESQPAAGSTLVLRLPLAPNAAPAPAEIVPDSAEAPSKAPPPPTLPDPHSACELRNAISQAREAEDWTRYAFFALRLGRIYQTRGNLPRARRLFARALSAAVRARHKDLKARALHDLFVIASEMGKTDSAQRYARRALRSYGANHPNIPALAHDVAYFWMLNGLFEPALQVFRTILPYMTTPHVRVSTLANTARAAAGAGDEVAFDAAWQEVWLAIERDRGLSNAANDLLELAHGAAHLGDLERAERAAVESLRIATKRGEAKVMLTAESVLDSVRGRRVAAQHRAMDETPNGKDELASALHSALSGWSPRAAQENG